MIVEELTANKFACCDHPQLHCQGSRCMAWRWAEEIASGKYSGIVLTSYPPQDPAVNLARAALEGKNQAS